MINLPFSNEKTSTTKASTASQSNSSSNSAFNDLSMGAQEAVATMVKTWQTQSRNTRLMIIAGLVVIGTYWLAGPYLSLPTFGGPTRSITVIGTGTKAVSPDSAEITFTYVFEGVDRQDAIEGGKVRLDQIMAGLSDYGVANIQKTPYQVGEGERTLLVDGAYQLGRVYQYVVAVSVEIEDPANAEDAVAYLYDENITQVNQVVYNPADAVELDNELLRLAIENARTKARSMTRASGSRLGRVLQVQEGGATAQQGSNITKSSGMAGAAMEAGSDASAGENGAAMEASGSESGYSADDQIELQSAVTVTFELW